MIDHVGIIIVKKMAGKLVMIFFLVVFFEVVFCEDELNEGDTGVCVENVRTRQSVVEKYSCGNKRRTKICNRKIDILVPTKRTICCNGWKLYKGKCIPEGPVCEQPCVNAQCTDNNNCTCDPGLVHLNETHCRPLCTEGFYNDLSVAALTCKSKCSHECVNGICTDVDKCTCNKGYMLKLNSTLECEPKCDECEHGVCVRPNNCSCNDGYAKNDSGVCAPLCTEPCTNGYCSAPEKCECNSGYSFGEGFKTEDGYEKHNNTCELIPLRNCRECEATCNETVCACANGTLCVSSTKGAIVASTPTLAGLQLTWMLGGALGLLLIVLVLVIIHRTWRQRKNFEQKAKENEYLGQDTMMFTRPGTLIRRNYQDTEDRDSINEEADYDEVENRQTNLDLLPRVPSNDYVDRI